MVFFLGSLKRYGCRVVVIKVSCFENLFGWEGNVFIVLGEFCVL